MEREPREKRERERERKRERERESERVTSNIVAVSLGPNYNAIMESPRLASGFANDRVTAGL